LPAEALAAAVGSTGVRTEETGTIRIYGHGCPSKRRRSLSEHPLSIHRPDNRLRSLSFATVRFSAFSASGRGISNGGERRRPCQQGLISPVSLIRSQPPPHFPRQDAKSGRWSRRMRARRPVRASTGASTAVTTGRVCHASLPRAGTFASFYGGRWSSTWGLSRNGERVTALSQIRIS
jgi:hypothetical protein